MINLKPLLHHFSSFSPPLTLVKYCASKLIQKLLQTSVGHFWWILIFNLQYWSILTKLKINIDTLKINIDQIYIQYWSILIQNFINIDQSCINTAVALSAFVFQFECIWFILSAFDFFWVHLSAFVFHFECIWFFLSAFECICFNIECIWFFDNKFDQYWFILI